MTLINYFFCCINIYMALTHHNPHISIISINIITVTDYYEIYYKILKYSIRTILIHVITKYFSMNRRNSQLRWRSINPDCIKRVQLLSMSLFFHHNTRHGNLSSM